MNHVERFKALMNFQPVDRLPRLEWAAFWDQTLRRWWQEGLPASLNNHIDLCEYFGLDPYKQFWMTATGSAYWALPPEQREVKDMDDYLRIRPLLYQLPDQSLLEQIDLWAARQARGEALVWLSLDAFFWFPRMLMGIERHLYAFYDQAELMHTINRDLCQFNVHLLEVVLKHCSPAFTTLAEDMSYNNGPMLSHEHFVEFLLPHYHVLVPLLAQADCLSVIDTDGDVAAMIPWLQQAGIQGVLPLERQAGVDGVKLRQQYPDLRMIGHFDKMVMPSGEAAMRREFERLLPLIRSGGYIPSVDHQTPPGVSLKQYRIYLRLLREFTTI